MSKRRNKSKSNHPNPYRLRVDEYKYNITNKRIECIIRYINPITNTLKTAKGAANCNPEDVFSFEVGKHLAEGRAKHNMYSNYLNYIKTLSNNIITKYDKLLMRECNHIQDIINEL